MAPDSTRPDTHLEQLLTLSDRVTVLRGWAHPLSAAETDELARTNVEALNTSPADRDDD
ncbi:hypothetical protein [Rathayibacter iranicus]|uniref:hypothetical protein n=1 Tax=Rathayibacter iranicus TaxID=59737 RepID=UPI00132BA9C6|nr:hypothetical protein [Rathayibacter iranicus]MWV31806.1 hypothetical protein [Rathayibacter iranicus NCPPB 2253 = VKM Ac-1602]